MLWSAKEKGFYDTRIPYPELPDDVVEITVARYDELLTAQSEGWEIISDITGHPDLKRRD